MKTRSTIKMRLLIVLALLLAGAFHTAAEDDRLALILNAAAASDNPQVQLIMLRGVLSGLQGQRDVPAPAGWRKLAAKLKAEGNAESAKVVDELAQIFGDEGAAEAGLTLIADKSAEIAVRRDALEALLNARNRELLPQLEALLAGPLALDAIRAYGVMPYDEAPRILLGRYAKLDAAGKRAVVETLASRKGYARGLLGALRKGKIPKTDIPVYAARSLEQLLGNAFTEVFGEVRKVSDDKTALMAAYKAKVASPTFAKADAHRGQAVYQKVCAACHTMYGKGGIIGPDLTGSNRADLDYLLLNVLDPNFDVPEGYRLVNVTTKDGRILTGTVAEENANTLVLSMVGQKTTVAKADIEERKVSPVSMMPEGLLSILSDGECLDLIAFLQTEKPVEKPTKRAPNVVFFLADDLGWSDVGCYGSTFHETPQIDRLAQEGVRFTDAYSTCHVCSPSRASILTGKYPARTDLTEWLRGRPERDYETLNSAQKLMALPDEEITLAETLKQHGYATANYGKAHLRKDPTTYGFDEAITGWVRSYYHPFGGQYAKTLPAKQGDYYTDKLTDAALDFIERNKDRPFFVHLEHFAVHDPIQGRKDLVAKYEKKRAELPKQDGPAFILEPNPDGPALSPAELKALAEDDKLELHQDKRVWWVKQRQDNVEFAGMLEATDESLGRIRAKLEELGLAENTIVIFTADNGGMSASNQYRGVGHKRAALDSRFASSNLPLRGAKGWNYEGGVRVPLIVHWPGQTKANTSSKAVITGTDFYPTLLDMLGLPLLPDQHVDGKSFVPVLKGGEQERGPIYWHFPHYSNHGYQSPGGAIRLGNYKLLEYYENGTVQLFDLENDLGEQKDLSQAEPETTAKLLKMLQDWRREVDAKMPPVKTATSSSKPLKPLTAGTTLPADVAAFAPGWTVRDWGGPNMKPGMRRQWDGRQNVLVTHPLSETVPCVLSRKTTLPAGKTSSLELAVTNHRKGDWKLVVTVNGAELLAKDIDKTSWQEIQVDLSAYAGKSVTLELKNQATGWASEAGYWSRIEILHTESPR